MKNMIFTFIFVIVTGLFYLKVNAQEFEGYVLYNKLSEYTAYLIDKDCNIAHSWSCDLMCNYSVYLLENGNLMRGGIYSNNQLNGGAVSGIVQEINPDGETVWEFVYSTAEYCSHHDIQPLPNGNVLLGAWEVKSINEAMQAGYAEYDGLWPFHIIEVEPVGTNQGNIVWEWHIWDHLIHDHDPAMDNYGVVADHP